MATFNINSLRDRPAKSKDSDDQPKAIFKAEPLTISITRPDGTVVLTVIAEPRGFTPKLDKRSNTWSAGVGWYVAAGGKEGEAGVYAGFPVSAGLRLSLHGVKVEPGDTVDLTGADSDSDGE